MKRVWMMSVAVLLAGACMAQTTAPAEKSDLPWTEDYAAAMAQAKKDHKLVLLNFTGSDWCVPCKALDRLVFASPEFHAWEAGKMELVTLDYPARTPQTDAIKARNKDLKDQYKVKGYPTILIVTPEGKELARTEGFDEDKGTAAEWLADVRKQMEKSGAGN
ncbi:MAG TPA: thioredoxin family protein [Phycisphaerae bacterium]|jgi:thiol:disulfide interchange protein|nr:thioredoxin family protein [Phycisphaerae bacterium]